MITISHMQLAMSYRLVLIHMLKIEHDNDSADVHGIAIGEVSIHMLKIEHDNIPT